MKVINYAGSNAVGKSTRTSELVRYLDSKFKKEAVEVDGTMVGNLYENDFFVVGKYRKKNLLWTSLDAAFFIAWEHRIQALKQAEKMGAKTAFMEGYFGNRWKGAPDFLKEHGYEEQLWLFTFYDKVEDYLERTNGRSGKNRDLEWAKNSSGWADNKRFKDMYETIDQPKILIPLKAKKDILIEILFNDKLETKESEWV